MTFISICRQLASVAVPHRTHMTTAPPARVRPRTGVPVLVPSLKRSGTHLLIDTVLNHFPDYRHRPLYIDFDQYARAGRPMEEVLNCGAYVIKTHYPQQPLPPDAVQALMELAAASHILQPQRDETAIWQSLQRFEPTTVREAFDEEVNAFRSTWAAFPVQHIAFSDMINPATFPAIVKRIGEVTGSPARVEINPPPGSEDIWRVMRMKLLTRLLGPHAPVVNTTVQFGDRRKRGVTPGTGG